MRFYKSPIARTCFSAMVTSRFVNFRPSYYALPAFPALALLVGAAWASGRDISRWLWVGLVGCVVGGAGTLWAGTGCPSTDTRLASRF